METAAGQISIRAAYGWQTDAPRERMRATPNCAQVLAYSAQVLPDFAQVLSNLTPVWTRPTELEEPEPLRHLRRNLKMTNSAMCEEGV
jgi:hypothetical protein